MSGLARCGVCDVGMRTLPNPDRGGIRTYVCLSEGFHTSAVLDKLDTCVVESFLLRMARPDA